MNEILRNEMNFQLYFQLHLYEKIYKTSWIKIELSSNI